MNIDAFVKGFKALGQPTRLQIIRLLAENDLCVCELTEVLQTSQPRISQHLKVLKDAGIVQESIEGSMRIYHLQCNDLQNFLSGFSSFLRDYNIKDHNMASIVKRLKELEDGYRYNR